MEVITKTLDELIDIPPNHFVFDIETTGLNSNYCKVILIGILFNQDNKTVIKQFFADTEDDEKELLLSFINTIKNYQNHITFNGLTFDIPFLNTRLKKHNIDFYLSKNDDIDILKLIRPFKEKLSLSDCKLKTIEKYLGIHREDTISGKESIDLYKDYSVNQNIDLKEKILLHNYEDIYYLGVIFKKSEPPVKRVVCSTPIRLCFWLCYSHTERFANRILLLTAPKGAYFFALFTGSPVNGSIYSFKLICS